MRVGNSSAMMAGWPAYMSAWKIRPMSRARKIITALPVSYIGKAKKPHVAASAAPTQYTGRRPTRSVGWLPAPSARTLEELGEDEGLVGPLLEAAHVDQARRDDLARIDRRHARQRQEHAAPLHDLDDEADDARELAHRRAVDDDDVADTAHLVPERVEDRGGDEAGDEDAFRGATHGPKPTS